MGRLGGRSPAAAPVTAWPRVLRVASEGLGCMVAPGRQFAGVLAGLDGMPRWTAMRLAEVRRETGTGWGEVAGFRLALRETRFQGRGWLVMGAALAFQILDHALGGPPGFAQPRRPLTDLEETVVREAVTPLLAAWGSVWAGGATFEPTGGSGLEAGPGAWVRWVWRTGADDPRFDLELAVDEATAAALADAKAAAPADADRSLQARGPGMTAEDLVGDVRTCVDIEIGATVVTLGDVAALEPGRLLMLDVATAAPWVVSAGGRPVAAGRPVTVEGRPHLLVTRSGGETVDAG